MRITRSPFGQFREKLYFSTEEIDRICCDALEAVGLLPEEPGPIRIDRFIEKKFGCSVDYGELPGGVLGCTAFDKGGIVKAVVVSPVVDDGTQPGRRRVRSTVAHEAGHGLMHQVLFIDAGDQLGLPEYENIDLRNGRILCRNGDFAQSGGGVRWWEVQANKAIGGLLLPKQLLEKALSAHLRSAGSMGKKSLPSELFLKAKLLAADVFDVNPIVAEIRLKDGYMETNQLEL